METKFSLDTRLEADTSRVGRTSLCEVLLSKDARFPWLILVPRRAGMTEIIDLAPADRDLLLKEIVSMCEALKAVTRCDKLNVAALGNMVSQLHVHVIARFAGDAAWPGPVWGRGEAVAYEPAVRDRLVERLRDHLPDIQ